MSKKRAYCPTCGERLAKKMFYGKFVWLWQLGELKGVADGIRRYRHFCKKEDRLILYPIWR